MKRYIKTSTFKKVNQFKFVKELKQGLAQLLSNKAQFTISPRYDILDVYNIKMSDKQFKDVLGDAIENIGYSVYSFADSSVDRFAAIDDNDAWASISFDYVDHEDVFEIRINCDHGNVILEDWYDDVSDI